MSLPKLQVKLLSENAKAPTKAHASDAGYDLYSAEDYSFNHHGPFQDECNSDKCTHVSHAQIKTDLAVAIPEGFYGRVASRSGLSFKENVEVGAGVVDSGFRGELKIKLYCHSGQKVDIKKGDRIAQIIITPYVSPKIEVVAELQTSDRGEKGFGSTGK